MRQIKDFVDTVFIHYSQDDSCWIAHSLRTDQVGTGADMGRALADLITAVDQVFELAQNDATIQVMCEAPKEIQDRAAMGRKLPREFFEVAHKIARGEWLPRSRLPPTVMRSLRPKSRKAFVEPACRSHKSNGACLNGI